MKTVKITLCCTICTVSCFSRQVINFLKYSNMCSNTANDFLICYFASTAISIEDLYMKKRMVDQIEPIPDSDFKKMEPRLKRYATSDTRCQKAPRKCVFRPLLCRSCSTDGAYSYQICRTHYCVHFTAVTIGSPSIAQSVTLSWPQTPKKDVPFCNKNTKLVLQCMVCQNHLL